MPVYLACKSARRRRRRRGDCVERTQRPRDGRRHKEGVEFGRVWHPPRFRATANAEPAIVCASTQTSISAAVLSFVPRSRSYFVSLTFNMAAAEVQEIRAKSYVGFDTITQQIEHKLLKRGFQFNVMVVGTSGGIFCVALGAVLTWV